MKDKPELAYRFWDGWCVWCNRTRRPVMSVVMLIDGKKCQRHVCVDCLKQACIDFKKNNRKTKSHKIHKKKKR